MEPFLEDFVESVKLVLKPLADKKRKQASINYKPENSDKLSPNERFNFVVYVKHGSSFDLTIIHYNRNSEVQKTNRRFLDLEILRSELNFLHKEELISFKNILYTFESYCGFKNLYNHIEEKILEDAENIFKDPKKLSDEEMGRKEFDDLLDQAKRYENLKQI